MADRLLDTWIFATIVLWLIFAKKGKEPGEFFSSLIIAFLLPLWIIIFVPLFYVDRKKLKWLRKKWLFLAFIRVIDFSMGWRASYNLPRYKNPV